MAQLKHRHGDRRANASSPLPVKSKPVSPPPEKAPIHSGSPFSPGHSPTGWSPLRQNSPGRRGASTSRHQFSLSVSALRRRRRRGEEGFSLHWSEGGSPFSPVFSPVFLRVFSLSFSGGKTAKKRLYGRFSWEKKEKRILFSRRTLENSP